MTRDLGGHELPRPFRVTAPAYFSPTRGAFPWGPLGSGVGPESPLLGKPGLVSHALGGAPWPIGAHGPGRRAELVGAAPFPLRIGVERGAAVETPGAGGQRGQRAAAGRAERQVPGHRAAAADQLPHEAAGPTAARHGAGDPAGGGPGTGGAGCDLCSVLFWTPG